MEKLPVVAIAGAGFAAVVLAAALSFASGSDVATQTRADMGASEAGVVGGPSGLVSSREAAAWAEARSGDVAPAYSVYLAAFPNGAFANDAYLALDRLANERPRRVASAAPVSSGPSRRSIAAACRSYVDRTLPAPSRTGRTVGGAAAGCGVGALAGGDDGRNCAVGAVVGGVAGAVSAESRERRRIQEVQYCIANGGPPSRG